MAVNNYNANGWSDSRSTYTANKNTTGMLVVRGSYYLHGCELTYSLTQQHSGKYVMRGTMSVISPVDGYIMQLTGRAKAKIIKQLAQDKPDYLADMDGKRLPELNLSTAIYVHSTDADDIKQQVAVAALRLYTRHAPLIHRLQGAVARPNTITPGVAAHQYADNYLTTNHPNLSDTGIQRHKQTILSTCAALPQIAMAEYRERDMTRAIATLDLSQQRANLLRKFWGYCLDRQVCTGTLPFPPDRKKVLSSSARAKKATQSDRLEIAQQDALYAQLLANPSGANCGIALQLWGGYSAKQACTFTWADVIWGDQDDYVRIAYYRGDLTGATHNYTAPLFRAGALVLRARYRQLQCSYSDDALSAMPIVTKATNPQAALGANHLVQHATMMLQTIGVSHSALHMLRDLDPKTAASRRLLANTYAANVNINCGLQTERGTAKYLLHQALSSNVTDDHYTSFSSDEAGAHLYAIMSAVTPEEQFDTGCVSEALSAELQQDTYYPNTTRHRVGIVATYHLTPGDEITIICPHGVTGTAVTRGYKEDGTLRRKSRTK